MHVRRIPASILVVRNGTSLIFNIQPTSFARHYTLSSSHCETWKPGNHTQPAAICRLVRRENSREKMNSNFTEIRRKAHTLQLGIYRNTRAAKSLLITIIFLISCVKWKPLYRIRRAKAFYLLSHPFLLSMYNNHLYALLFVNFENRNLPFNYRYFFMRTFCECFWRHARMNIKL